jgi:hypothetical protein
MLDSLFGTFIAIFGANLGWCSFRNFSHPPHGLWFPITLRETDGELYLATSTLVKFIWICLEGVFSTVNLYSHA